MLRNHRRGITKTLCVMTYLVHNLQEGSRPGNWIRYWEAATGQSAILCHKVGCTKLATDGAHVQLVGSTNQKWYIVPLCHECNCDHGATFLVSGPLVGVADPKDILW